MIALSHDSLGNHYTSNFELMQNHKLSLQDLDEMLPFEREIYIAMLNRAIQEKNEKANR